jgi:hypothetical protein
MTPRTFDPEFFWSDILAHLMLGRSLRSWCALTTAEAPKPSISTVLSWVLPENDPQGERAKQYARAREVGLEIRAEEIIDIADRVDAKQGEMDDAVQVHRDKLRTDNRKWELSKLLPKKYGDRLALEHDITDDAADRILRARARFQQAEASGELPPGTADAAGKALTKAIESSTGGAK